MQEMQQICYSRDILKTWYPQFRKKKIEYGELLNVL